MGSILETGMIPSGNSYKQISSKGTMPCVIACYITIKNTSWSDKAVAMHPFLTDSFLLHYQPQAFQLRLALVFEIILNQCELQ